MGAPTAQAGNSTTNPINALFRAVAKPSDGALSEQTITSTKQMLEGAQYPEVWLAMNVAKIGCIDKSFQFDANEFGAIGNYVASKLRLSVFDTMYPRLAEPEDDSEYGQSVADDSRSEFTQSEAGAASEGGKDSNNGPSEDEPRVSKGGTGQVAVTARGADAVVARAGATLSDDPDTQKALAQKRRAEQIKLAKLEHLRSAVHLVERLIMGWHLIQHHNKSFKAPQLCVLYADLSVGCFVYVPLQEADSSATGDVVLKSRKKRILFSEVLDIVKGLKSGKIAAEFFKLTARFLTIDFSNNLDNKIDQGDSTSSRASLFFELQSDDERDMLYDALICLLARNNERYLQF